MRKHQKNSWTKPWENVHSTLENWSYTHTLTLYPEFFFFFHFRQKPLILSVTIILIQICQSVKGDEFLGSNKFRYTVLLSQQLLSQSHQWDSRWMCKSCWKLTSKKPERCHWRRSDVIIVNFTNVLHLALVFLVFLLLTWNK